MCSGCGKKFSKWQSLALHINGNSCTAVLPQNAASESAGRFQHLPDAASEDKRLICQIPEVSRASRVGINAFISLKQIMPQLLQTCALCGQWCSSHRTLKRHYQHTHSDLLQHLGTRIKTLVVKTATASSTCLYCQAKCKDWKGHLTKCTVAWQRAVMVLMAQADVRGGGRAERVFRRGEAGDASNKRRRPAEQHQRARATPGSKTQQPTDGLVTSLARLVLKQEKRSSRC